MNGNQLITKHSAKFDTVEKSKRPGVLATLRGPVTGWKPNRNGRTYSRELWVKALDSDYVKEQVALNHFVGEADHPEERLEPVIQNMSHAMRDFEFDDANQEVIATIDILDTPCGNMLKTLYDYSGALSFSTRGSGDVLEDGEVDPDTYQLFAIDAVLRPSYATATVRNLLTESENLHKNKDVEKVLESYSSASLTESVDWDYYNNFKDITNKYLPDSGEGDSMASQIVTAINKLVYKWYNDGDIYDNTNPAGMMGWANDLSSYANWLAANVDGAKEILDGIYDINYGDQSDYEDLLRRLADEYLTDDFLSTCDSVEKSGSIYNCDGPYKWSEEYNDDEYYESHKISKSGKLVESAEGLMKWIWGNDSSFDNLSDEEIENLKKADNELGIGEDDLVSGKMTKEDFKELIDVVSNEILGLNDEEKSRLLKLYDSYFSDEDSYEDDYEDSSFTMYNQDYDKTVTVEKIDGKWVDSDGNRYMGYLSKADVKSYFKGNWIEESQQLNEYGDTKDYSEDIQKLFKKWFKDNADLGIRAFQALTDSYYLDIETMDKGEGSERRKLYKVINNSPFVEVEEWADEIGEYIADNLHSLKYIKSTYNDKSFFSDDETAGDITWYFVQQIGMPDFGAEFESEKLTEGYSLGDDKESFDIWDENCKKVEKIAKAFEDAGLRVKKSRDDQDWDVDFDMCQDNISSLDIDLPTYVNAEEIYENNQDYFDGGQTDNYFNCLMCYIPQVERSTYTYIRIIKDAIENSKKNAPEVDSVDIKGTLEDLVSKLDDAIAKADEANYSDSSEYVKSYQSEFDAIEKFIKEHKVSKEDFDAVASNHQALDLYDLYNLCEAGINLDVSAGVDLPDESVNGLVQALPMLLASDEQEAFDRFCDEHHEEIDAAYAKAVEDAEGDSEAPVDTKEWERIAKDLFDDSKYATDELVEESGTKFNLVNATDEDIVKLADGSAFTFEGLDSSEESLNGLVDFLVEETNIKTPVTIYTWKGEQFNTLCELEGSNAYPSDLTFVSIALDSWPSDEIGKLAMVKMQVGARWLDDIVSNNAYRGGKNIISEAVDFLDDYFAFHKGNF